MSICLYPELFLGYFDLCLKASQKPWHVPRFRSVHFSFCLMYFLNAQSAISYLNTALKLKIVSSKLFGRQLSSHPPFKAVIEVDIEVQSKQTTFFLQQFCITKDIYARHNIFFITQLFLFVYIWIQLLIKINQNF